MSSTIGGRLTDARGFASHLHTPFLYLPMRPTMQAYVGVMLA